VKWDSETMTFEGIGVETGDVLVVARGDPAIDLEVVNYSSPSRGGLVLSGRTVRDGNSVIGSEDVSLQRSAQS
jgi:hypothetical protein